MPGYLVDTVIFIDHLNGIQKATRWLRQHTAEIAISVITRAEVLTGCGEERPLVAVLLDKFPCHPIDSGIADLAATIRQEAGLKLPDAFQAALTEHYGLRLVTRNTKDFPPKRFPQVLIPYRI